MDHDAVISRKPTIVAKRMLIFLLKFSKGKNEAELLDIASNRLHDIPLSERKR